MTLELNFTTFDPGSFIYLFTLIYDSYSKQQAAIFTDIIQSGRAKWVPSIQ